MSKTSHMDQFWKMQVHCGPKVPCVKFLQFMCQMESVGLHCNLLCFHLTVSPVYEEQQKNPVFWIDSTSYYNVIHLDINLYYESFKWTERKADAQIEDLNWRYITYSCKESYQKFMSTVCKLGINSPWWKKCNRVIHMNISVIRLAHCLIHDTAGWFY